MNRKISGGLAGGVVVGALLVAAGASASTPTTGQLKSHVSASTQVRLVTGDIVNVKTDATGRTTADVAPSHRAGLGGLFQTFNLGSDVYVVPLSAAPYLGSTLNPALFDVSRLARDPAAGLRVDLTLRPGSGAVALPGATVHRTGATTATATFTRASARTFGLALARQAARDRTMPSHTTGLFRSIARISPTGTPAPQTAKPADTHTLTVNATDYNGNPDNGDSVNVYNVDDFNQFATSITFQNGTSQLTVPDGHYSLLGFFFDFTNLKIYETAIPQFTVSKDKTVSIDARDATSLVTVTTPKPSTPTLEAVGVGRTDALGVSSSYTFLAGTPYQFYAAPTKKAPSVGQFHYYVYARMFSTGSKKAYTYDVKYPSDGTIKADQSYLVKASQLATIKSSYPADHPNQLSLDGRFAALPWETILFTSDVQFTAPLQRTEYYLARPDVQWEAFDYTVYIPSPFTLLGEIDTSWRAYTPGDEHAESFRGQPLHPRLLQYALFENETVCPVCATSSNLDVLAFPFADNSQFHRSYPDSPTAGLTETTNWSVKADSSTVASGTGVFQASPALVAGAKTYTLSYDMTRSSTDFLLSTDIETTWKVKANAAQATLPDGWVCSLGGDTDCGVLPVMTNDYQLPVDLLGRIKSGDTEGTVDIGHLADANINVKSLTSDVSFDGGTTWTAATVTSQGNGEYTIDFTVPSKGQTDGYGALRITAKDAAGGQLSQTVLNAFAVK